MIKQLSIFLQLNRKGGIFPPFCLPETVYRFKNTSPMEVSLLLILVARPESIDGSEGLDGSALATMLQIWTVPCRQVCGVVV